MSEDALISLSEAGHLLGGICVKTVRRRIAAGELPQPVKEGKFKRFFRSDILARIDQLKQQRKDAGGDNAIRN